TANGRAPLADLLSTFTACWTLEQMGELGRVDGEGVLGYARSLEQPGGGFRGGLWDEGGDGGYTFYGLGGLAVFGGARPAWRPAVAGERSPRREYHAAPPLAVPRLPGFTKNPARPGAMYGWSFRPTGHRDGNERIERRPGVPPPFPTPPGGRRPPRRRAAGRLPAPAQPGRLRGAGAPARADGPGRLPPRAGQPRRRRRRLPGGLP